MREITECRCFIVKYLNNEGEMTKEMKNIIYKAYLKKNIYT